jgi:hypothetical protein
MPKVFSKLTLERICKRVAMFLEFAVCLALLLGASNAQTITGSGTNGNVPVFTGSTTIGNSKIQQVGDSIGINTGYIVGRLSVAETRENGVNFSQPYAIYGNISSDLNFAAAVRGDASATTGNASGVIGVASSPGGNGVVGLATAAGTGVSGSTGGPGGNGVFGQGDNGALGVNGASYGDGGTGVQGTTNSLNGFAVGTRGTASATTGNGVGIFGEAWSPFGIAGLFINRSGGDVIAGRVSQNPDVNDFRVDGRGTVYADGGFRPFGADFAESIAVKGGREDYAPGDLLVVDPSGQRRLSLSQSPYSTLVAGIYSTQPGFVASQHSTSEALPGNEVPLAVVGIVPCKVTAENGAIAAGDLHSAP